MFNLTFLNMIVWILSRNDINCPWQWAWLVYICPSSSNLVCNEGQRVSPYFPRQSLTLFMEDSTNYCYQKKRHNFHSSSEIRCKYVLLSCRSVAFTVFRHTDIKGGRQRLTSTASLEVEAALASNTFVPFTWRLLTFTGWIWRCYGIIVIKTDLSEYVVPIHEGACETSQIPWPIGR